MIRPFFAALPAFALLAACGAPEQRPEQAPDADQGGMEHGQSHAGGHEQVDHSAPLPDDGVAPVVEVSASWMRPHPGGRDVTAAYFIASLSEGSADRLVAARMDGAERIELHGHTMDESGVMRMRPSGPQRLEAGDVMVFQPGGLHLMVFGMAPKVEGESVEGVLVFERAGEVPVTFAVQSMPPG